MRLSVNRFRLYSIYLFNYVRMAALKIRYGSSIRFTGPLCFNKTTHFSVTGEGRIILGEKSDNRGELFLLAHGGTIEIGKHCFFNTNCSITSVESIRIGSECKFGNNVVVVDHDHDYKELTDHEFISSPVHIGDGVWIGAGCIILRGVKIGDHCVVAAGSVVRENIPDNSLYYNPGAKGVIKKIENVR